MAASSDPPGDTIVVREMRNGGSEDGGLSDDDDLDIYSQDGVETQANVSAPAAADGPAESAAAVDDYAKSFDSPIREQDVSLPRDETETVVSAPSLDCSSHKPPEPTDTAPDQRQSNSSPLASEGSAEASLPSLSGAQSAGHPVAQSDAVAVTTTEPADGARPGQQHQPPQDPSQLASQPALRNEPSDSPKPRYEESSYAGNDANLALDIQELVNDINAASPSVSAVPLSSDSSASDPAGHMQPEPGSPPAAAAQTASANDASTTGLAPPNAPSLSAGKPPQAMNQQPPKPGDPNPMSFPAHATPPTGPAALVHGKKGPGGVNKGGRGAKNGNAIPPSGPAATRGAPSGPKAQSGSRHNARNAGSQTYDMFLADERRYTAEAKWEKFPDGSRIFVGRPRRPCRTYTIYSSTAFALL